MTELPTIRLKPKEERRLRQGHCWIYSNEVDINATPLKPHGAGTEVLFASAHGDLLGRGYLNPHSLICGRLLTRDPEQALDLEFISARLQQARAGRDATYSDPYYRSCFGDADGLSGLVVDRFGDYLVVQLNTAGMAARADLVLAALKTVYAPKAVLWRNDSPLRAQEGLEQVVEVAWGEWPDQLTVIENGVTFKINGLDGQKTGWFYDHRENRQALTRWVAGGSVLDVFSYIGGWGLQALAAGATELTAIDASEPALTQLQRNASAQGVAAQVQVLAGNAFERMAELVEQQQQFNVVVIDPPAFIKRRKDHRNGLQAYRKLNTLALKLVAPGGVLVSASCSMHLTDAELQSCVAQGARQAGVEAQWILNGSQAPDHPVHPAINETRYLKAQYYRVLPSF